MIGVFVMNMLRRIARGVASRIERRARTLIWKNKEMRRSTQTSLSRKESEKSESSPCISGFFSRCGVRVKHLFSMAETYWKETSAGSLHAQLVIKCVTFDPISVEVRTLFNIYSRSLYNHNKYTC